MMQPLTAKLEVWYVIWRHWPSRGVPAAALTFNTDIFGLWRKDNTLLNAYKYEVSSVEVSPCTSAMLLMPCKRSKH